MKTKFPKLKLQYSDLPKFHAPELYADNAYSNTIYSNPFALSLLRTHLEPNSTRFPNGSLIRLVPKRKGDFFQIKPVEIIDHQKVEAPSYILCNRNYIKYVQHQKHDIKYAATKFKNRIDSLFIARTRFTPNLDESFQEELEARIKEGLKIVSESDGTPFLELTNTGKLIDLKEGLNLNIPSISDERRIAFQGNETLCYDLLRLAKYFM